MSTNFLEKEPCEKSEKENVQLNILRHFNMLNVLRCEFILYHVLDVFKIKTEHKV